MIKNCDTCQKNSMVRGCNECNDFDKWAGYEDKENKDGIIKIAKDCLVGSLKILIIVFAAGMYFGVFLRVAWEFFLLLGVIK